MQSIHHLHIKIVSQSCLLSNAFLFKNQNSIHYMMVPSMLLEVTIAWWLPANLPY